PEGVVMIEVADVMTEERIPIPAERESRLELSAERERRVGARDRQADRAGGIASRAPDGQLGPGDDPRDRVVAPQVDRPVVEEEEVGDAGESLRGAHRLRRSGR